MKINLETLIPYDRMIESPKDVFDMVDEQGHIVLLRNNMPAYILMNAEDAMEILKSSAFEKPTKTSMTLHEAMRIVLSETKNKQLHAADLADEIYRRGLYFKKDGSKAEYNQIRARCSHYDMFETLQGNIIRLKDQI